MLDIINFTRQEYVCVGKLGELSIGKVLKILAGGMYCWNFQQDNIEFIDNDVCPVTLNVENIPDFDEIKLCNDNNQLDYEHDLINQWRERECSNEEYD